MDWEYVILTNRNLISIRAWATFSVAQFEEMIRDIQSHEQWQPTMDRLVDFTAVDLTETTANDIKMAAEIHKRYDPREGHGRIAVVFGKEESLGIGRMYENYLGADMRSTVKSFKTADEARQWLA